MLDAERRTACLPPRSPVAAKSATAMPDIVIQAPSDAASTPKTNAEQGQSSTTPGQIGPSERPELGTGRPLESQVPRTSPASFTCRVRLSHDKSASESFSPVRSVLATSLVPEHTLRVCKNSKPAAAQEAICQLGSAAQHGSTVTEFSEARCQ